MASSVAGIVVDLLKSPYGSDDEVSMYMEDEEPPEKREKRLSDAVVGHVFPGSVFLKIRWLRRKERGRKGKRMVGRVL